MWTVPLDRVPFTAMPSVLATGMVAPHTARQISFEIVALALWTHMLLMHRQPPPPVRG
jgi:hypothetical protein